MFVSSALARRKVEFEHVHVNTWDTVSGQVSDHDPAVASFDFCER